MDNRITVQVTAGALILLAMLFLMLPIQWVGAAILAAAVHECCHCVAVFLFGGRIRRIRIGGRGTVIETEPLSGIREAVCALAGPLGSFLLVVFIQWMPRTAICGLVHGLYNLLPMLPLDGGRIIRGILSTFLSPPKAEKWMVWICRGLTLIAVAICLLFASRATVLLLVIVIILRWRENSLAKNPFWRYNRSTIDSEVRL